MGLGDLRNLIEQYDGDIKRMEMDKHLEKMRDVMLDPKEELRKLEKALAKEWTGEIEQNPLATYSTTELKKELRRRKGKTK